MGWYRAWKNLQFGCMISWPSPPILPVCCGEQSDFSCTTAGTVLLKEETGTNPEAGEVRIGGIIGLVVSFHQGGDNPGLLVIQTWPHCLPGCLLLFPLQDHVLLPLNLLVRQDDCKRKDALKYLTIHWPKSQADTFFPNTGMSKERMEICSLKWDLLFLVWKKKKEQKQRGFNQDVNLLTLLGFVIDLGSCQSV